MPLTLKQQTIQAIKKSSSILIVFKDIGLSNGYPAGGDTVAASLALYKILEKNNKKTDIASPNFSLPAALGFLPNAQKIKHSISSVRQAELCINIKEAGIKDFSYKIDGNYLKIYLTPNDGALNLKNIKTDDGFMQYDLIISLGTPEINFLGDIYKRNKILFDSVPIINIDISPTNENYGEINFIDVKSSSVSEIIWRIMEKSKNLDKEILDLILAGIIAKTKNFRKSNLNPKTLETVKCLVELGADRNEITKNFYRTKSVETLKLWGRTLARLKQNKNIVWSVLTRGDFIHSGADENALPDVIHELIANSPMSEIVIILFEAVSGGTKALIYSENKNINMDDFGLKYLANQLARFDLPFKNLMEAEKRLINHILEKE